VLCALALLAAGFPPVELELDAGAAHTLEGDYSYHEYPFLKPALQARVGLNVHEHLSVGASFLAVIGGEAANRPGCCGTNTGNQAFSATAAFIALRYLSVGMPQYWIEGGIGTGHLISLQTENSDEHPPLRGHAGLSGRIATGVRWPMSKNVLLGGELGWTLWTNVEQAAGAGPNGAPAQSGLWTHALLLLASIAFSVSP
jgi:hypothetical protein